MSTITPPRPRRAYEQGGWPARARTGVRLLAGAVLAVALLVVVAWYFHLTPLLHVGDRMTSIKMNTAVAMAALAGAHLATVRWARLSLFGVAGLIGALVLAEYALGTDLGVDELLIEDWTTVAGAHEGRPAQTTAACLTALALAGVMTELGRRTLAQLLAGLPLMTAMIAVYGYLYRVEGLYDVGRFSSMPMLTAGVLVVLSFATWLAVPSGVVQWISFGTDTGAALQRRLVPVGVVLLPFAGWLEVQGLRRGWYPPTFGAALLMSFAGLVVCVVGYRVAGAALALDRERDALLDELHRVNAHLEDRVRVRSHQLNRQRTKLALFEERDRIARDLHDRVIQRIFAAGLQVAALGRTARKEAVAHGREPTVADTLDGMATELDLAIRELRNSIFELTNIADHDRVDQVVQDIASRAARILGFMPLVEVTGAAVSVPPHLVAQLASVVQEGLSNIARHAAASRAEVVLLIGEDDVELRIKDDGVGLPDPPPRSSGLTNMLDRARALGGTATWSPAQPSGTLMVWRVPRVERAGDTGDSGSAGTVAVAYGNRTSVAISESDHSRAASTGS